MEILTIALRNVFRNVRRSLLNILAVAIGIMVVLNLEAWVRGFEQTTYTTQMDLDTAHVQILRSGYQEEKERLPLDLRIKNWNIVKEKLKDLKGLVGIGARIDTGGNLSDGNTSVPVMVRGVDPEGEALLTILKTSVVTGHYFENNNDFLIGKGLADKLKLEIGQQVFLTALDQYGVRNLIDGKVGGIFASGYGLFDDNLIFLTLKKLQNALALEPGAATRVVLRFDDGWRSASYTTEVQRALEQAGLTVETSDHAALKAYEWKEFAQTVVHSIEARIRIMVFLWSILLFLVVVGILNSMSMAVQERYREIGTMRAMGMNRRLLRNLFLAEGLWIGLLGGIAGITSGGLIGLVFWFVGVDPRSILPKDLPIPFTTVIKPHFFVEDFFIMLLLGISLAVLGAFLPARRAARMTIQDSLGSSI